MTAAEQLMRMAARFGGARPAAWERPAGRCCLGAGPVCGDCVWYSHERRRRALLAWASPRTFKGRIAAQFRKTKWKSGWRPMDGRKPVLMLASK